MALRSVLISQKEGLGKIVFGELAPNSRPKSSFLRAARDLQHSSRQSPLCTMSAHFRIFCQNLSQRLSILSVLFAKQCNVIAAQRIRRAVQILNHYNRLGYDKNAMKNAVENLGQSVIRRNRPLFALLGASLFQWEQEKITKEELKEVASDISHLERPSRTSMHTTPDLAEDDPLMKGWEKVIDRDHFKLWRKPIPNSYLYQYKVFGTYVDLPARAFFEAQLDTEFRKQWDRLVIKLDVIDKNRNTGDEVVQWIMHFPYPMYSREYVFIRNTMVDPKRKLMVIVNRSVEHPSCPRQKKYVRVDMYMSNMVIRAHSSLDKNGFDYVLTYYDEPKAAIPTPAYNWMARSGVPDFVDKVHNAAKKLYEEKHGIRNEETACTQQHVPM